MAKLQKRDRANMIIHYQVKLQIPLCYDGRTENVTFSLSDVTCKNCLEIKRREQSNKGIDWKAVKREIAGKLPAATAAATEFCFAHHYQGNVSLGDYPPRILMTFYVPALAG